MAHPYWPLFDLRIRTERLELRPPDDADATALAALAAKGIHPADFLPFSIDWTSAPSPQLERGALQHYWRSRATWSVEDWNLPLAVLLDGRVVGTQNVGARKFPLVRSVNSGSWLGQEHQGQGIGKEMRAAMLHLAFAGLGADHAFSGAWHDNAPSLGVSRALGYEENGWEVADRRGAADRQIGLVLTRGRWLEHRRHEVSIENLEPCLPMFGLASDLTPLAAGGGEGAKVGGDGEDGQHD